MKCIEIVRCIKSGSYDFLLKLYMFVKVSKIELKWVLIGCIFEAKVLSLHPTK